MGQFLLLRLVFLLTTPVGDDSMDRNFVKKLLSPASGFEDILYDLIARLQSLSREDSSGGQPSANFGESLKLLYNLSLSSMPLDSHVDSNLTKDWATLVLDMTLTYDGGDIKLEPPVTLLVNVLLNIPLPQGSESAYSKLRILNTHLIPLFSRVLGGAFPETCEKVDAARPEDIGGESFDRGLTPLTSLIGRVVLHATRAGCVEIVKEAKRALVPEDL